MSAALENSFIIDSAARIVRSGGVVIVPTETFYALAADPFQIEAVKRIFQIKRRSEEKPLPLIAAHKASVEKIAPVIPAITRKIMDHFWPGSLTILLEVVLPLSKLLSGPTGKIGVRVPPDSPAKVLAEQVGGWITATSANLSGDPSPDRISCINREVLEAVDIVMDMGTTPGGKPSTVVEPLEDGLRIVREGGISRTTIIEVIGPASLIKSS